VVFPAVMPAHRPFDWSALRSGAPLDSRAVPLASAALFDLGVFLTVVGATMTALVAMGRLTPAEPQGAAP